MPYGQIDERENESRVHPSEEDPGVVKHKEEMPHHTKDNFLLYQANPLKTTIQIIVILI